MERKRTVRRFRVDIEKIKAQYPTLYIYEICRELGITRAVWDRMAKGKPVGLANARKIMEKCPNAVEEVK